MQTGRGETRTANVAVNSNVSVSGENTDITSNVSNTVNEQSDILEREEESGLERKSATIKTQVFYSVPDNQNYCEIEYDKYGNVISKDVCYEVSENLNRIQAVRYDYSDAGRRMGCKTENYDENGNTSQIIERFEGSEPECTKYQYVYDNFGNPIEMYTIHYDSGEVFDYYYIYEYDSMGNILVEYQYFDFEAYKNADKDNARYITYYTYYE